MKLRFPPTVSAGFVRETRALPAVDREQMRAAIAPDPIVFGEHVFDTRNPEPDRIERETQWGQAIA